MDEGRIEAIAEQMASQPVYICISCDEKDEQICPASKRDCGHHCNHLWSHDNCCWCEQPAEKQQGEQ